MKILELGKFYPPHYGGIETLLRSWCEGFTQRGAQVDCVVASDTPRATHEEINGVRVHRLGSYGLVFSTSLCPSFLGATRRFPADLWHAHFPNPLADLACLLGPKHIPLVLTYHSDVVRQAGLMMFYRPLLQRMLARATKIIIATPPQLEYSPWLARHRAKCEIIPFGLDLSQVQVTPESRRRAEEFRQRAGGLPILLNIGRLVGYKGQRFLIEAARELNAVVWLVGTGPLEAELKRQSTASGLGNRVHFWGAVDNRQLAAILQACDVFVLPSITPNEAFGLVQVEAMACGKPVVSCAVRSGVPYVNLDRVTGRVVPPADARALAAAIRELLDDAPLCARLSQAGQKRAQQEFELSAMLQRYWNCFERVLDKTFPR